MMSLMTQKIFPEPLITSDTALKYLKDLQKYQMNNQKGFDMVNQPISMVQNDIVHAELNRSTKQTNITAFFQKP